MQIIMFTNIFQYISDRLTIKFYNHSDYEKWQNLFSDMYLKQNQWDWEPEPLKDLTKDRFEEKLKRHELERKEGNIYYFCIKERGSKNIIETDLKTPDVTK